MMPINAAATNHHESSIEELKLVFQLSGKDE